MTANPHNPHKFVNRWRYLVLKLDISPNAANVLHALLCFAKTGDGSDCWPSIKKLKQATKLHERTVQRTLRELEDLGILKIVERPYTSSLYIFGDPDEVEARLAYKDETLDEQIQATTTRTLPDEDTPPAQRHPLPGVTPPPPRHSATPSPGTAPPYQSSSTRADYQSSEQQAAPRTHERAEAPVRESQPPAASPSPVLADKGKTQGEQRQAAASETAQAATQGATPSALEGWLGDQLTTRGAGLTRQLEPVSNAQLGAAARQVMALASGDEARARAYVAARLDAFELRGPERPVTRRALLKFLADRADWLAWERDEAAADGPGRANGVVRDKAIPVGRPPRAGMRWEPAIGKWVNSNAIHTGLFRLPGCDDDDVVELPTPSHDDDDDDDFGLLRPTPEVSR